MAYFDTPNYSHVQANVRPYVIVQNDCGNRHSPTTIICPLTTRRKRMDLPTHVLVNYKPLKPSMILCEHIRTVDISKHWKFLAHLPEYIMIQIDEALKISLGLM